MIRNRVLLSAAVLAFAAGPSFPQRLHLAPRLHAGQTLFYRIDFRSSRNMRVESRVVSPQLPSEASVSASGLLQVEITEVTPAGFRVKSYYSERNLPPASRPSPALPPGTAPTADKLVEVSIAADGTASQFKGMDQLSPAQQFAWNNWLGRFTASMTFPKGGVSAGQKWEVIEPESTPSPLAGLSWKKNYHYVRDEPCRFDDRPKGSTQAGSSPEAHRCAVIVVRSHLRQASSAKNATPEDYKLRDLRTRGTAAGQNDTILYVSRSTGLLVRSSEDAQQSMDAVVVLADGSNQVHYNLEATSHSEVAFVPDSPQDGR